MKYYHLPTFPSHPRADSFWNNREDERIQLSPILQMIPMYKAWQGKLQEVF